MNEFLSPEYAVPAFLVDNGVTLQTILDAKETLAEAIIGTVDRILEDEGPTDVPPVRGMCDEFRHALTVMGHSQRRR